MLRNKESEERDKEIKKEKRGCVRNKESKEREKKENVK